MRKKLIATLLFTAVLAVTAIFPATDAFARQNRRNLIAEGSDFAAILYDSANGLPTSEANDIAQSEEGFIWIGSYSGLIKYDGSSFERFDSSTGISSVYSLFVDSKNRVWIGTNENGIAVYDHTDLKLYGRSEALKSYSIRSIIEDPNGNILIGTTQGMAYIDPELNLHVINDPLIDLEYIVELRDNGKGSIYGLTQDGDVFTIKDLRVDTFYPAGEFGEEIINSIYPDPYSNGIVYMGTVSSTILTVNAEDSMKVISKRYILPQSNVNCMKRVGKRLWIATENGVGFLDESSAYHTLEDVPLDNSITRIMKDHEGNLWFTSSRQGLMELVPDRFSDYTKMAGLDSTVINSTCLKDGQLYIATDTGLIITDNETYDNITNDLTEYLNGVRIRCIYRDSKDNIWLCTRGETGLVCRKPDGSFFSIAEADGIVAGQVRDIIELSDGRLAAATSNGLYILKDDAVEKHYGQTEGIYTTEILSVEEGPDGTIYLGSDGDGIYVLKGSNISRIGFEDGLTSGVVMRIKWDPEREVFWLITSNSIQYIKDGEIHAVTNFPYSNNLDIFFDKNGGAWVLSSNGIYITRVEELLANESIRTTFYNTKNGLPYLTTANSRSYLDEDGSLYITGTMGITLVNINEITDNSETVKLSIPSVDLDTDIISTENIERLDIPANTKRLTINAYAITFSLNNPRLSYYLEGFDSEPIYTTKHDLHSIVYTNLGPGKYTFHMNLLNELTGEVEKSISLSIQKEPAVYENLWFIIMIVVLSIALIAFILYKIFDVKNKALQEKRKKDQQFISQIIKTFAKCIDMRDSQNRGHSFRVAYYTRLLAKKLADKRQYSEDDINTFYNIALLHDIGKLSIPDSILNKPSGLSDEEFEIMKSHAKNGELILKEANIVENLAVGAGCHHERMDGKGYPHGLKGSEIPEVARIIAVADTFDAMYSTRPYRKQMLLTDVMDEIKRIRGTQLEEEVVDALFSLAKEGALDKRKVDEATKYDDELTDIERKSPEPEQANEQTSEQTPTEK